MHPWCRCSFVPVYKNSAANGLTAGANGGGDSGAESADEVAVVNMIPAVLSMMPARVLTSAGAGGIINMAGALRDTLHEKIESGAVTTVINREKQLPHIKRSPVYRESDHKSYFYEETTIEDLQKLVDEKKETGEIYAYASGEIVEYVRANRTIGEVVDPKTGESLGATDRMKIHYSRKRTHVVPTRKEREEE